MKKRHLVPVVAALAGALAVPAAVAAPAASSASSASHAQSSVVAAATASGTTSLADVLLADGNQFDGNWYDYDIVTEAVLAVLAAKPDSPVGLLTHGDVPLTAFIPNDRAFQVLAADLTGRWYGSETKVFRRSPAPSASTPSSRSCSITSSPAATITSSQAAPVRRRDAGDRAPRRDASRST